MYLHNGAGEHEFYKFWNKNLKEYKKPKDLEAFKKKHAYALNKVKDLKKGIIEGSFFKPLFHINVVIHKNTLAIKNCKRNNSIPVNESPKLESSNPQSNILDGTEQIIAIGKTHDATMIALER